MARLENDLLNYNSKYLNDGTLINKLGINDKEKLEIIEREMTTLKLARLYTNPELSLAKGKSKFSVEHYLNIHKFLFDEIYPFAGEIRSENIAKRIPFCLPQNIYYCLKDTLDKASFVSKKIKTRDDLLNFITYFYSEIDVIHPFREGNGRCEREFFRQYVLDICNKNNLDDYYLDFSKIGDKDYFIESVIKADIGQDNDNNLREIFDNILIDSKKLSK